MGVGVGAAAGIPANIGTALSSFCATISGVSGLAAAIALATLPPMPAPAITLDVPGAIGFVTVGV